MGRESRRKLKAEMLEDAVNKFNIDFSYFEQNNFKMALLRLYNIQKDFRDSVAPYKSVKYLQRDFFQPFLGFYHILRGFAQILLLPIVSLILLILTLCNVSIFLGVADNHEQRKKITDASLMAVVDGFSQILHGAVQVLKIPFTLVFQIPYRSILTAIKGWQPLNENAGIKDLKVQYQSLLQTTNNQPTTENVLGILLRFQEKYETSTLRSNGQTDQFNSENTQKKQKLIDAAKNFVQHIPKGDCNNQSYDNMKKRYRFFHDGSSTLILFKQELNDIQLQSPLEADALQYASELINTI